MLELPLHVWEDIMRGSVVATAVVAIVVGISTWQVVQLTRAENRAAADELERYKAEAAARTAEAIRDAAHANERAAEATRKQAELEAKVAWRRLTKEQADIITTETEGAGFPLQFQFAQGDPEATTYAGDLFMALQRGIKLVRAEALIAPNAPVGVVLTGRPGGHRQKLETAFTKAGVAFEIKTNNADFPQIYVGSRPPPF